MNPIVNWKTTGAGLGMLLVNVLPLIGPFIPPQYQALLNGVFGALLGYVAKDGNVTGGTIRQ